MSVRTCILFTLFAPVLVIGQDVKVSGRFLTDSIKIGQPVPFSLSVRYPWERTILFPDSTYNFKPFEFVDRQYFPTHTTAGTSYDSVVYYFNSFEIDSIQWLKLPVYVVQGKDSIEVWSQENPVWLRHLVTINTDSVQAANLPLKVDAYYVPVDLLFNYPVLSLIVGTALLSLVVGWFIFGNQIRKFFKVRSMRRAFEKYIRSFNENVEGLKNSYSIAQAERALSIWKKYLELLEEKPFTKYTSKEILAVVNDDVLASPLRDVDRLLYAGASPTSLDAFYELKSYSEDCFYKRLQEINSPGQ